MEQAGWPIITAAVSGIIVFITTVWIVKVQVVNFSWAMLIFGCIMIGITAFCVWYSFRTRQRLQGKYQEDLAALRKEFRVTQDNFRDMISQESNRLNEWTISFSQASDKEHRERTDELKRQCMETIHDAEQRLDVSVKNSMSLYKDTQETARIIIDQYREQLIITQRKVDALEKSIKEVLQREDKE
ncbi:MAG TPA: hypothetical protein VEL31_15580 [Ktedonobacteraceae bacterium]|nr:hypothetical protein [Ktedonobacteraceae bacterium]